MRVDTSSLRQRMSLGLCLLAALTAWGSISTAQIKNYDKKLSVALAVVDQNFAIDFSPSDENNSSSVDYHANTASLSGIQLSYLGLTLAYLTSATLDESQVAQKGKTSYEDLRGSLALGRNNQFIVSGYYNRFKRFFINNTAQVDPTADLFLKRSDIETFNTGGSLLYIWNPKSFSATAAYQLSDRQMRSGGSFLLQASFDANTIKGDDFLIPSTIRSQFGTDQELIEGKFATISASLGYSYTLVWKALYANAMVLFGRGYQTRDYQVGTTDFTDQDDTNKFNMGVAVGINADSFFFSLNFTQEQLDFETESITIKPGWRP